MCVQIMIFGNLLKEKLILIKRLITNSKGKKIIKN